MTTTVRMGTAAFQITMTLLLSDSSFAPARLMTVNSSIAAVAMSRPVPFNVPFGCNITRWSLDHCVLAM